jgi:hypothetical protein
VKTPHPSTVDEDVQNLSDETMNGIMTSSLESVKKHVQSTGKHKNVDIEKLKGSQKMLFAIYYQLSRKMTNHMNLIWILINIIASS